ncbi:MAG: DNA cytosine methyltransferase [Bacteroidaceae bacterium]|nr:DNA cytosine methyltransferase [Bacteroidaceae bacterium]
MKDLNDITLKEFQDMECFGQTETFNNVIIVPTDNIHDSGYRCMKFVLVRGREIVGCVGGYSDVVRPNGTGNMGLYKIDLPDGDYIIRKLTPLEYERLQTLPDKYTEGVADSHRYTAIGNGWTVDVIAHIMGGLRDE